MARKKRLKIALIGYGAISQTLFDVFREKKPAIDIVGVLVRPGRAKATQKKVGRKVAVVETLKALLEAQARRRGRGGEPAGGARLGRDHPEEGHRPHGDRHRRLRRSQALQEAHQGGREERRAAAPAVGRHRRPRRAAGHAAGQARAREVRVDQAAACLERHAGRDRVRPAVDQGADGDLPRQARRCRPALPEERQSRGDGGAVRRRASSTPTSSWWPIPPCRPAPMPAAWRS